MIKKPAMSVPFVVVVIHTLTDVSCGLQVGVTRNMYDMNEHDDGSQLLDMLKITEALYTVAMESDEPEMVRAAFGALAGTQFGRNFLEQHPVIS